MQQVFLPAARLLGLPRPRAAHIPEFSGLRAGSRGPFHSEREEMRPVDGKAADLVSTGRHELVDHLFSGDRSEGLCKNLH